VNVPRGASWAALLVASLACPSAFGSESSDELVRQARAHEAAHEDDLAARRYTEALTLDALSAAAWLGLGELRIRTGEPIEAERVYTAALARLPLLIEALKGRAEARWVSGRRADAEADLQTFSEASADPSAYRELANWFGADGRAAAQLAIWRHILAMPAQSDAALREARRMITALIIIVGYADPACWPIEPDPTRLALARICPRGATLATMPPSVDAH
jgi:tetratricopeptide (TPR) repeat protein